jgi:hypothetical protein
MQSGLILAHLGFFLKECQENGWADPTFGGGFGISGNYQN